MADILLVLLLSSHVVLAHVAAASPLVACGLAAAARQGGASYCVLGRRLSVAALWTFGATVTLGSVLALWSWSSDDGRLAHAVGRLPPAKLWFAVGELIFYAVCQLLYVACWDRALRGGLVSRMGHHLLALLASTNLLYHFPPLFVILALPEFAALPAGGATPEVYRQFVARPEVLALSGHHWLAAAAVAGVTLMALAWRQVNRAANSEIVACRQAVAWGARLALGATLLQVPVGIFVLVTQPAQSSVLGGDAMATVCFLASLATALSLMHHLAAAAFGECDAKIVRRTALLLFATIVLMTAALHHMRAASTVDYVRRSQPDG